MKTSDLLEQRAAIMQRMNDAHDKDDGTAFDAANEELRAVDAKLDRARKIDAADRADPGLPLNAEGDRQMGKLEQRVSLHRTLQAQLAGRALDGAEAEYNQEITRRNGKAAEGAYLPLSALEKRVNTAASASELVGTQHRPQDYIGPLRNSLLARRLGVRVLTGLSQNLSIPKHGTSTTSAWVADNSALTPSDMTFDNVGLSPKHVGSLSEMSRSLIQQSSPEIEQLLRDDMAFNLAQAIDSALIEGGGANEPDGVIATLGTANATLETPTWAEVLAIIAQVEEANALGSHSWLIPPAVKALLQATLKVSGDAGAGFLLSNGMLGDYPAFSTNQVPTNNIIFGDWSQMLLGLWSELDVLANPYESTAYARGGVMVRAMATADIAMRHAEAFAWADDVPAGAFS
ncbi:phage major capsid protein [Sphingopyxis sp. MG]|uniref:phage major capsid protein n=1 Tax=Sphingopyxis sp. MG TaxID=1866325 RepID=UPI000CDF3646|nr:phage major capsid protein [Sphingopyxis sp. MG]AVA14455.1 phage major capsid protein [Sphingopyxis sp. MG]